MGDEELEEGFANFDNTVTGGRRGPGGALDTEEGERRLSRDLERGFRDSSDEEDDDRRRGRR